MTTRKTTAHTPGPWIVDDNPQNYGDIIWGPDGQRVADAARDPHNPREAFMTEEAEANAALIAAAPALLEAAEAYIAHRFDHEEGIFADANGAIRRCTDCDDYDKALRAAIAQAKGVTP